MLTLQMNLMFLTRFVARSRGCKDESYDCCSQNHRANKVGEGYNVDKTVTRERCELDVS